jgi:hypothetical protein
MTLPDPWTAKVWTEADGTHIDVRGLGAPQPLVQILRLVAQSPPDRVLIAHLDRDPVLLYPELLHLGWWAEPVPGDPGEVRLRLARTG